jgi:hypothetical protein
MRTPTTHGLFWRGSTPYMPGDRRAPAPRHGESLVGDLGPAGIGPYPVVSQLHVEICGIQNLRERATRELGYWIRSDHTGNGYAKAAAMALTVEALRLPGVEAWRFAATEPIPVVPP